MGVGTVDGTGREDRTVPRVRRHSVRVLPPSSAQTIPHKSVYLVGDDRLELLAIVDVRRDPAWIEGTIAEDANGPENAFVQVRPCFPAPTDDGQQPPKTPRDRSTSTFERQPHAAFSRAEIRYRPMSGCGCGQNMVAGSTRPMG